MSSAYKSMGFIYPNNFTPLNTYVIQLAQSVWIIEVLLYKLVSIILLVKQKKIENFQLEE